jgi:hypothetical protein
MTAIVPIKTRSKEILGLFKEYKEQMENELGQMVKRFRSDGGGEYEKGFGATSSNVASRRRSRHHTVRTKTVSANTQTAPSSNAQR